MSKELEATEDKALDALLAEVHGNGPPPELTAQILSRLKSLQTQPIVTPASKNKKPKRNIGWVVAAAGLAASLMFLVWLSDTGKRDDQIAEQEASNPQAEQVAVAETPVHEANRSDTDVVSRKKPRPFKMPAGIPLASGDDSNGSRPAPANRDARTPNELPDDNQQDITLVSVQHANDFDSYWKAVGVQPMDFAEYDDIANRLQTRLGILISREGLQDPKVLQQQIIESSDPEKLAKAWLDLVTDRGFSKLKEQNSKLLMNQFAKSIRGEKAFDETVSDLTGGNSEASPAWYAALAASGNEGLVRRLCSLTLNMDLRCIKCHDSKIERGGQQHDYWSVTALVRQSLRRDRGGYQIEQSNKPKAVFYELADGRQQAAQPKVPAAWTDRGRPMDDLRQWSQSFIRSERLARGTINSLWKLVHGRSLHASALDAVSAPNDESLKQLEDRLVAHLIRSDFDISSALALIITSPLSRLSVPDALRPENSLLVKEHDAREAMGLVGAFAANLPSLPPHKFSERVDLVMRSAGGLMSLPQNNDLNAQANANVDSGSSTHKDPSPSPTYGLPTDDEHFPVHWLASLDGFDSQVQHLAYLAGNSRVPDAIAQAATTMEKSSEITKELALQRVWWLLQK